jgi:hypothetical protein
MTMNKTNIVVNCPVIFTPLGGMLPGVTVTNNEEGDIQ